MILNIRVDHKTADIQTMENSISSLDDLFNYLKSNYLVKEFISIKTCNRTEYYVIIDSGDCDSNSCSLEDDLKSGSFIKEGLVIEKDQNAMEHLLRLSSGLESMIIGEDQILGQIRDAKRRGIKEDTSGLILNTIFTKAIHVGQAVRKKTHINRGCVSIGSAAVELAEEVHGNLKCKKVLVVGAGKMGTLVAKALVEKHLKAIVVANRTYDRAVELAKELGGYAIHFDLLMEFMADADVIISATGAPHPILTYEKVKDAVPPERRESLVMVDIANPRDIEDRVVELGVKVFNIDNLRGIADENRKMREEEAKEAEKIVQEELILLEKSLKHIEVEPLISQIRREMELIRINETQKAINMLGELNGKEKVVENLTKSVVDKIFFDVVSNIKQAAENQDDELIKACELIFRRN
ncbi:MAG: glutamyl-tRNA reductase [Methanobacteriaceae archaeon]|nr:glutamyl-tRNA reductase [Methanobacteriaceae archaeon]MDP2837076.1 glutamyl-tRNA reductase [Methanobacteriaceae archaeon]MDP3034049.1 glutamyl-tRNA reductase [Methanobacteriaceae archaeon]MDP3484486.1 glutamyl-tRNA reductase [Methanobacteriaceae archaeon]